MRSQWGTGHGCVDSEHFSLTLRPLRSQQGVVRSGLCFVRMTLLLVGEEMLEVYRSKMGAAIPSGAVYSARVLGEEGHVVV